MKIRVISVGRSGAGNADSLAENYLRRIRRFCPVVVTEVRAATGRAMRGATRSQRESRAVLAETGPREFVVALDATGRSMDSGQFARWLEKTLATRAAVTFLVGGADGLDDEVRARADLLLSLSAMTLPHELARAVLAEQVYRAFSILRGTPYNR